MRVVLVAADDAQRHRLQEGLHARGHEVVCRAEEGDALAAFRDAPVELAIVDLALPDFQGPEFCRRLRASPEGAWCVIVVLTPGSRVQDIDEAVAAGADDYLVKGETDEFLGIQLSLFERRVQNYAARRQAMDAFTESERRFWDLLEAAPDAIFRIDPDGRISSINEQAEKMSGYSRAELLGRPIEVLMPEHYRADHAAHVRRFFERPMTRPMGTALNLSLLRKDGGELPVDICLGHHRLNGKVYAIASVRDITERRRMEEELRLAKEAAERAYERIHQDLQVAARVQRALLPTTLPEVPGVRFAWEYRPCAELAGDGLNVFWLDESHVGLYLLDVSGHGVTAALLSVTLARLLSPLLNQSTLLRVPQPDQKHYRLTPPVEVAQQLNRWFLANPAGEQYFTLVYGVFDVPARCLRFVSAGHPGLLYAPRAGEPTILRVPGSPIGCIEDAEYEESALTLHPGDRLFLYSDGVIESFNPAGEAFGATRLRPLVRRDGEETIDVSVRRIFRQVLDWSADSPHDDLSMLAVALEGDDREPARH
ncbi:MAG TPA: SpoIIE family protein phosphatase [Gemmataceae bacterium]